MGSPRSIYDSAESRVLTFSQRWRAASMTWVPPSAGGLRRDPRETLVNRHEACPGRG